MPEKVTQISKKPNILVIWGDDIGITNLSCYSHGAMGYKTPNIDRIAKEGMMFTDAYGEQSCTASRAGFITGQSGYRTGLTKVGIPGAKQGLKAEDATTAELLKPTSSPGIFFCPKIVGRSGRTVGDGFLGQYEFNLISGRRAFSRTPRKVQ